MGTLPNVFTGYQAVVSEEIRKKFEDAWGSYLPRKTMSRPFFNIWPKEDILLLASQPIHRD